MLNPAEVEALSRGLFPEDYVAIAPPPVSSAEGMSMIGRIGAQAANLPSNTINELFQSVVGFGQLFAPESDRLSVDAIQGLQPVPRPLTIAPATTTGGKVVDFLGGEVAPSLAAALIPYAGASKALRLASIGAEGLPFLNAARGISPVAREAIAQGFAGATSGVQYGPEQAVIGAAVGGLGGYTEKLGRAARFLPSLGIGAGEFVGQQLFGGMDVKDAALTSTVDFLANMLPGKIHSGPYDAALHSFTGDIGELFPTDAGRAVAPNTADLLPHEFPIRPSAVSQQLELADYTRPFKSAQDSAEAMLQIPFERTPHRLDANKQAILFDLPDVPRQAAPVRQTLSLVDNPAQMNLTDNWGVQARFNPLQLEHGAAQREFAFGLQPQVESRFTMDLEPRVTPPAIDSKQMTLNSLRLQQVLEGRKPEWDATRATLFDLEKYPISRNFELVDPKAGTVAGDARGGIPHLKNVDDPTQMNLEDLFLRKAMEDASPVPPVKEIVGQQMKTAANPVVAPVDVPHTAKDVEVVRGPAHKITGEFTVTLPTGRQITVQKNQETKNWMLKPTEKGYEALPGGVLTEEKGMDALKRSVLEHDKAGVFDTPKPTVEEILEKSFGVARGSEKMAMIMRKLNEPEAGTVLQELLVSVGASAAVGGETYRRTGDPVQALIAGASAAGIAIGGIKLAARAPKPPASMFSKAEQALIDKNRNLLKHGAPKGTVPTGEADLHTIASNAKGRFDRVDPTSGKLQFTLLGEDIQSTVYLKKGSTKEEIEAAFAAKRAEFDAGTSQAAVQNYADLLKSGGIDNVEDFMTPEQLRIWRATNAQSEGFATQMKMGNSSAAAFIGGQAISTLAGASIGATYGYSEKGGLDSAVGYAIIGAGLGLAGARAMKRLQTHQGPTIKGPKSPKPSDETVAEKLKQLAVDTAKTPGGLAVAGRGGMLAHTVRTAESWLGLNAPWLAKEAKLRSEGLISDVVGKMQDTIDSVKKIIPSAAFVEKASLFMKGQLAPAAETVAILKRTGAVTQEDWEKIDPKLRTHLTERWVTKTDATNTNTTGTDVQIWRTTNTAKTELSTLQQVHLARAATSPSDRQFMALPIKAREAINTIQGIVLDAIPDDVHGRPLRNKLLGTFDQYQTRTFEMFTNKDFYPTEQAIQNRIKRVAQWTEDNFLKKATKSATPLAGHQEVRPGVWIPDAEAKMFKELYTDLTLRQDVEHEIVDYKRNKASFSKSMGESSDMDASLLGSRKELTADLRELLGEHKNVTDEIVHTMNRLVGTAQAAKMITLMGDARLPNGLRMAYDQATFIAEENGLRQVLTSSTDPRVIRETQNKLAELSSYIPTMDDPRLGLFGNKRVSRFAHDQLKDYRSPWGIFESPMGRTISQANNAMKMVHAPYSAITQVRNLISVPAFLAAGRATDPGSLKTAFDLLTNKSHPLWSRMRQLGVENATQARGEFKYGMHELVNGQADGKIMGALRRGHKAVLDLYSKPDMFVRIATFLSAEKRLGKANPSWSKADVESAALKWTDRRTMDYNNVPAAIKTIRQVPFVNMYISYAYEALRIMKNMAEDAAQGDIHAGATLAGIATIPFIMQAAAENSLPPDQKKKWDLANKLGPDYSRTRFKIPTGRVDARGNMFYFDVTPLNIIDNYAQMVRGATRGDWASVLATNPVVGWENTPMFTIMAGQIAGRDLRSHREFRDLNDRFTNILQQTMPNWLPGIGYEAEKITPAELGGTLGVTNLKTGRTDDLASFASKMLTGANYTSINPGIVLQNAQKELQNEIKLEKQFLNDVLKSTVSPAIKQTAIRNFQEAAKVHMMDFYTKVNGEGPAA